MCKAELTVSQATGTTTKSILQQKHVTFAEMLEGQKGCPERKESVSEAEMKALWKPDLLSHVEEFKDNGTTLVFVFYIIFSNVT